MLSLSMLGVLVLMFLLCDADSHCPLILNSPEVIGEFGETVLVNCTSTEVDHEGMSWRIGNTVHDPEIGMTFVLSSVSLTDWNVEAQCRIQIDDTNECSQDLKITIYRNPDSVVIHPTKHTNTVVGWTVYELHCLILNVAPVQNLTVRWYKDNETIMTESFLDQNKKLGNVSTALTVNISRGESGTQYKCEAQLDLGPDGPKPPVMYDTYNVSGHYAPELRSNTVDEVFVYEGKDVSLSFEADGSPPPDFNWTCDGVKYSEKTNRLNITQIIANMTCSCTVSNNLGSITKHINVHVIKTIRSPNAEVMTTPEASINTACPLILTPAELVVRYGDPASVNCTTSATDNVGMGWEASVGGTGLSTLSTVTWKVDKLEQWTSKPVCFLNSKRGQCLVTPAITLYKLPDTVSVSAKDAAPKEDTKYVLNCDIFNVAPVQKLRVKWYRGDEVVHEEKFDGTIVTPVNVSSFLTFTAKRDVNGVLFRCEAELQLGPKGQELTPTLTSSDYTATVHYQPLIRSCPDKFTAVENQFSLNMLPCQADGNPPPNVSWYYAGRTISETKRLNRTHAGMYSAVAANVLGTSTRTDISITFEYGPSFHCNEHYEVHGDGILPAECEPRGNPKPELTWFKNGGKIATPRRWTKNDDGEYLVQASNKHGSVNHTLYLQVLYAPVFKRGNYTEVVAPGENVTFDCSAEGNPPPEILWKFDPAMNVVETTGGRQKNISVTGATSTNAGVYICVATNKVGSASRSVKLAMKAETSAFKLTSIWWWVIPLIIGIMLVLFLVGICTRRKKQRKYSFVPNKARDDSDIPMATKPDSA